MWIALIVACVSDPPSTDRESPVSVVMPTPQRPVEPLSDGEGVRIVVSFAERAMQRLTVSTTRTCPDGGTAEWWMANWTPGSYLIRDHARKIETMTASSGPVHQIAKNRWTVPCNPGQPTEVVTTMVASDKNVRGNFIGNGWATVNPPAAFLLPEPPEGPFDVRLETVPDLPDVAVPLPELPGQPGTYRAEDLDTLIDSPMVVGDLTTETFTIGGAPHHFVTFGDEDTFDRSVLSSVVTLVETQQAFWGDVPYPAYWFFQAFLPTYGGLEHAQSTLMMSTPSSTENRKNTIRWLGLVSHEFFHTWNVQRMRPRNLVAQDYETEAHTELLWVAEGWTSYYDDLLLARADIIDEAEYLELLGQQIDRVQSRPGRLIQSLAASSFNAWTKYYKPTPHQLNSTIGYYEKGAVVGWLLDAEIRRATQSRASLDDVLHRLRERSEQARDMPLSDRLASMGARRAIRGFTPDDVREVAAAVAGRDLTSFFRRSVDAAEELDYGSALQWFGLKLTRDDAKLRLGVRTTNETSRLTVRGVFRDGPAWKAGINVGDELISIDDRRVGSDNLGDVVKRCKATCDVTISREGRVLDFAITPAEMPGATTLEIDEGASPMAARRRRAWLDQ
ncbi:MAG: PDZ domain-containing protein [Myxococcota bacterium]